jgi:adenylate cyclase
MRANGQLVPIGGGDTIPLVRDRLTVGRRDSCDVCLRFPNISGMHCELVFRNGVWHIRDLGSTNGVKVNNQRVQERVLRPGDELAIATRRFKIQYEPGGDVNVEDVLEEDVMGLSLLEKAGLQKPPRPPQRRGPSDWGEVLNE